MLNDAVLELFDRYSTSSAPGQDLSSAMYFSGNNANVIVHLIDGTYELFRHFYGLRRFTKGNDTPFGAVVGVLNTVLQMIEKEATHIGVATDHVIESFRNELWTGYKRGDGIDPTLLAQFQPLEDALAAMGIVVWPMIELEADDALASAAAIASKNSCVQKICIWTPDKDLAQCVREDRIVQVDRRSKIIRDADGVRAKFGVSPVLIPDYLALVGDTADGYPGVAGIGSKGAVALLTRYGRIEDFPPQVLGERRDIALLFKKLATLRTDASLFADVDELEWRGPTDRFAACSERLGPSSPRSRRQSASVVGERQKVGSSRLSLRRLRLWLRPEFSAPGILEFGAFYRRQWGES